MEKLNQKKKTYLDKDKHGKKKIVSTKIIEFLKQAHAIDKTEDPKKKPDQALTLEKYFQAEQKHLEQEGKDEVSELK